MTISRRIARSLLASMFVVEGVDAAIRPGARVERAESAVSSLHELTGLPDDPALFVRINGAVMATAATALACGKLPRAAAFTLAAVMVPTTYAGQPFWSEKDPELKKQYRNNFLRNLSLIGGLLIAGLDTNGEPSLKWRVRNNREQRSEIAAVKAAVKEISKSDA